jgi:3-hydroxybutyryl-CoA dehydrogenase
MLLNLKGEMMEKIAVLGAGTMGSGIAQVIAQSGYEVILRDIKDIYLNKGLKIIENNLDRSVEKERITESEKKEVLNRINTTIDLEKTADVDLIIEAAVENIDIKKEIFKELDKLCKEETIFASNTSALSITEIASVTRRPEKVIGIHFFNPVPVMKLVEVIKGIATSENTFDLATKFINNFGKKAVEVNEAPGFVVNRLLIPMINESIFLLEEGVASAEDIDKAMKFGANHPIGPLALADLIGLDICLAIMNTLYEEFNDSKYRPSTLLKKKVRAGHLGRKTDRGFYNY